jgi:LemA protein
METILTILSGTWRIILLWIVLVIYIISWYNTLVRLANNIKNAFADIDVQLKARFDLIDNLVSTVKGYATHEKSTLEQITWARTSFLWAKTPEQKMHADGLLTGALKSLFAVSENYPDLKANQNFLLLQQELSDIENKIAATRRYYNASVNEYNTAIQSFPTNIIAKIGWFVQKDFFDTPIQEKELPKVSF